MTYRYYHVGGLQAVSEHCRDVLGGRGMSVEEEALFREVGDVM